MEAKSALISACGQYRYDLWRRWDDSKPYVLFVCLNPSTADAVEDDTTLGRCVGFAKRWGFGALCMVNLFAYRATAPADMKAADDPVGPSNDWAIGMHAAGAGRVVVAWGVDGVFTRPGAARRDVAVLRLLGALGVEPQCLTVTATGQPGHPLYLPGTAEPKPYTARGPIWGVNTL